MRMLRVLPLLGWVLIPGCASYVASFPKWTGYLGRSLSVVCRYDKGYVDYYKYWCKGAIWRSCKTVVQTTKPEAEVKNGRTSIKDNRTLSEFTVRLDYLTKQDDGIYWCAIQRTGSDLRSRVNITVLPALNSPPQEESTTTVEAPFINPPSTDSLLHVSFLISIGLKTPIFLCLVFAIIWMRRKRRQHSEEEAPP